jgi:hypothetical protein
LRRFFLPASHRPYGGPIAIPKARAWNLNVRFRTEMSGARSSAARPAEAHEMKYMTPRMRPALTRLLIHEAGGDGANSQELAAASGRLLDRLSERLSVVIGRAGVEAILLRAVKLRKVDSPFLDERMFSREQDGRAGDFLRACLQEQASDTVREASVTLFATFAGLLATVIGEKLARSLLRDVWPETLRSEIGFQEAAQ